MQVITTKPRSPTGTPTDQTLELTKRAFDYLRVSSDGQVRTDYDPDGLSISAQREAAMDKARELEAKILREFSDPGKSAYVDLHKRTGFLDMLDELKRCNESEATRVDYVIVWSLSRWARNQRDYWMTRELVRQAGARLVSVSEPMIGDDSAAAFFTESIIAAKNQYESMQTSENVKRSLYQKAKSGGTYGWTRLGYLNDVDKLPDGRRVSIAVPDPDRQVFMTHAFRLYVTGEYSLSQLSDELYLLGLRSRARKQRPPQQVNGASLQRVLRDPYYAGWIVYKRGTPEEEVFEGRHEPLIDQETFDAVQIRLDEKRVAGERPQKRQHYLKGSLFCDECNRRLVYGLSRSCTGKRYAYYFCVGRVKGSECTMHTSISPKLIEQAIQRYYVERPVQLRAKDIQRRTQAIEALVAVSQQAIRQVRDAKTQLIAKLEVQQDALVDMRFEEKSISASVFKRRQATLETEIEAARVSLAETEQRLEIDAQHLRIALELADNVAQVYAEADEQTKRGYNQAFFKRLFVVPEWDEDEGQTVVRITRAELTEPYALLLSENFAEEVLAEAEAIKTQAQTDEQRASESQISSPKPFALVDSSYFVKLAERGRFELPRGIAPP
jgi:site-specific DNA recombinase